MPDWLCAHKGLSLSGGASAAPGFVKASVSRLLDQFGVDSRISLVIAAHQSGFLR